MVSNSDFPISTEHYRIRFVTQYITYLNIWGALSKTLSSLSPHYQLLVMGWQWRRSLKALPIYSDCWSWVDNEEGLWKRFPYIQISNILCYKPTSKEHHCYNLPKSYPLNTWFHQSSFQKSAGQFGPPSTTYSVNLKSHTKYSSNLNNPLLILSHLVALTCSGLTLF